MTCTNVHHNEKDCKAAGLPAERQCPACRGTRAVLRPIAAGQTSYCAGCDKRISFQARVGRGKLVKVVCNIYEDGVWSRTEQFHTQCYDGRYGEPENLMPEYYRRHYMKGGKHA